AAPLAQAARSKRERALPHGLRDLQAFMVEAICAADEPDVRAIVRRGPGLSPEGRLGIYRYGYRARLIECLQDDYPVLAATLGAARFEALAERYVAQHPSGSPSLNRFGRHMAKLCADMADDSAIFYAELAALEWALVEVIHAEAPAALDLSALQQIPGEAWAGARLIGSEALRLLSFTHPVNAYYQAYRRDGELPPLPAAKPSATAIYRQELTLWRMDLTPAMTRLLRALLDGRPFAESLAQIGVDERDAEAVAEAERSVMVWFQEWVRSGFFARIVT
ncbi:MAG TPA: DNA-binding domain-containing protein, partial [Polyangiales bacterium]